MQIYLEEDEQTKASKHVKLRCARYEYGGLDGGKVSAKRVALIN